MGNTRSASQDRRWVRYPPFHVRQNSKGFVFPALQDEIHGQQVGRFKQRVVELQAAAQTSLNLSRGCEVRVVAECLTEEQPEIGSTGISLDSPPRRFDRFPFLTHLQESRNSPLME